MAFRGLVHERRCYNRAAVMELPVYLDYAATTPVDLRVLDEMLPYFSAEFGNPSSTHRIGQRAEGAIESARERVAAVLCCEPGEVIFTSCGTESSNAAIRGVLHAERQRSGRDLVLTTRAEHPAVGKTAESMLSAGARVTWLPVEPDGTVTPEALTASVDPSTALVSIMYANNEIGSINDLSCLAERAHRAGTLMHSDAVQAAAYLPLDVNSLGIDLLSLGAHKFYGPKGVGALYIRRGVPFAAAQTGGGQESGFRAGTHNVPLIVGFAKALELAQTERAERTAHVVELRDQIINAVLETVPESQLTGSGDHRLPNHASFVFRGVDGNGLVSMLDAAGFACSSGSACKSGDPQPSEVMRAIGVAQDWALGSLRVTVGKGTTQANVQAFLTALPDAVRASRLLVNGALA